MTYRVLMVCTGNICRSVMAETVLAQRVDGLEVQVDSAGISAEEEGNPIDYRAARILSDSGYRVPDHRARQLEPADLADFDLILAMTEGHRRGVARLAERSGIQPRDVRMYRSFDPTAAGNLDVPDPWYGDLSDFAQTLSTIEAVTPGLIEFLAQRA